jgi:hypothetical protein
MVESISKNVTLPQYCMVSILTESLPVRQAILQSESTCKVCAISVISRQDPGARLKTMSRVVWCRPHSERIVVLCCQ